MSRLESLLLDLSVAVSCASGVAYLVMRDYMTRSDPFSILGHPWQPGMLAAHVLVGPVFVLALGLILREHVLARVRTGRPLPGRASGLMTILLAGPMILSGYVLQVVTAPGPRRAIALTHLVTGVLFGLLFAAHVVAAVVRRRAPAAARDGAGEVGAP